MRGDRLLSILLLLQARGAMTATALAGELGVSVRTIYRDMDVLSASGVPIYGDAGPSGGYRLTAGYRTELTGLTSAETEALGLLSLPDGVEALGSSAALQSAIRKVLAAIPSAAEAESVRSRILVYRSPASDHPVPRALRKALIQNRELVARLRHPFGLQTEQAIEPLGLVWDRQWHVVYRHAGADRTAGADRSAGASRVAGGALRVRGKENQPTPSTAAQRQTIRSRPIRFFVSVAATDRQFATDPNFDLRRYWDGVEREWSELAVSFGCVLRVAPHAVDEARRAFHGRLERISGPTADPTPTQPGARTQFEPVDLWGVYRGACDSLATARTAVLSLGGAAVVTEPVELAESVADYAAAAASRYLRTGA